MNDSAAQTSEAPVKEKTLDKLPVSVITGFLGSGKTTLLRHLLTQDWMADTAVVINEFGEIGLDHELVEAASEDTILLSSGCLCCTVRGDLIDTLRRLYKQRDRGEIPPFRRLVIETTGLADPAPILHTLIGDPLLSAFYRLDGVVTTVDAVNAMAQMDRQPEPVKQAAVADRLLLTKTDLMDEITLQKLEQRLRDLNPAAPIYRIVQGQVDARHLFNAGLYDPETKSLDVQRWLREEAYNAPDHDDTHGGHDHHRTGDHHHAHDVNRHDDHIRAFCLTHDAPLDWDRFVAWIEMLTTTQGANLLRVKGILNVAGEDKPVAVHGVQHLFHPAVVLPAWPSEDRRSRLVFITRDLDRDVLGKSLADFQKSAVI
ncbi:CobW family GTP-binding protein [Dongia soli]|uniref:GTP-binding protein n=1 Tax=Dongia soli TaxID=600628 RepID=A0ABU5E566_9PROT|nr:GTP-binding protein [Dongia soli]MDY0881348.1 GTP-binding protein [Dongia soli]